MRGLWHRPRSPSARRVEALDWVTPALAQCSQNLGTVRQLVAVRVPRREMTFQERADATHTRDRPFLVAAGREFTLHLATDRLPLLRRYPAAQASVGKNFNVAVGQQQIDQDAIPEFGIPDAEAGEHLVGPFARRSFAPKGLALEARLDHEPHLARVPAFRVAHGALDGGQRVGRETSAGTDIRRKQVPEETCGVHLPAPRGAAATETAAATAAEAPAAESSTAETAAAPPATPASTHRPSAAAPGRPSAR